MHCQDTTTVLPRFTPFTDTPQPVPPGNSTDRRKYSRTLLIHSASIYETNKFILYASLVHGEIYEFHDCTVNGVDIPGKSIGAGMFECDYETTIQDDALLSIKVNDGRIVPSIATWKNAYPRRHGKSTKSQVCILSMVKDEEQALADWLGYYSRQGVEGFLLYENNSTDNTAAIAKKYKNVAMVDWPWHKTQVQVFVHGVLSLREVCEWVLLVDVDEFLYPREKNMTDVRRLISQFAEWTRRTNGKFSPSDVSQVCFDSKDMGPSGHIKCPNTTLSEAYVHVHGYSNAGKCAVRPNKVYPKTWIHRFTVRGKTVVINRSKAPLVHYKYQCWEHHLTKYTKGRASSLVSDWTLNNAKKAKELWLKPLGRPDMEFRDYKRRVDEWPLPNKTLL